MIAPACRASNCGPRESAGAHPMRRERVWSQEVAILAPSAALHSAHLPGQVVAATTTCPEQFPRIVGCPLRITLQLLKISASIASRAVRATWLLGCTYHSAYAFRCRHTSILTRKDGEGLWRGCQPCDGWSDVSPPDLGGAGVLFLVGFHSTITSQTTNQLNVAATTTGPVTWGRRMRRSRELPPRGGVVVL
jgi:hypothetical protein